MSIPDDQARIASVLVHYLRLHPQASDTAEGIARWWLRGEPVADMRHVQLALDRVTEAGLVERIRSGDGRIRYRRNRNAAKFERAAAILLPTTGGAVQ